MKASVQTFLSKSNLVVLTFEAIQSVEPTYPSVQENRNALLFS